MSCATRILRLKDAIKTVYVGIKEPGTFIAQNDGQNRLEANGVKVEFPVEHWRDKITKVSMNGH
jgi:pyrimidine deaminase RibD-like protein